ncbi:hypothetical protein [Agromyces seonyuensis]|uniref:Uncharacterized protein n=1 Tax=Agromyces seonyuensis TaxID=2662446 RepID=A0A6I4NXL5_9MICO|nr:hypothetical protein [Agromyces seonyuensis]MWB97882.1 hypothetical protein [Agromyces seonyuensis]
MTTDTGRTRSADSPTTEKAPASAESSVLSRSGRSRTRVGIIIGAAVLVATAVGVGIGVAVTSDGTPVAGPSDGPVHLWNVDTEQLAEAPGAEFAFDQVLHWAASDTDELAPIVCPAESTGAWTFVSEPGSEHAGITGWKAYSMSGFDPEPAEPGRLEVLLPVASLDYQSDGSAGAYEDVRVSGGTLSTGVACVAQDGAVTAAHFRTVHVTAGTGAFTIDPIGG